ncbi:MAG: hypothetical protein RLZZ111_652 [Planctomycetota bacterium]
MVRLAFAFMVSVSLASIATAEVYQYADTNGFTIGLFPSGTTPSQFAFPASGGPIDMTRSTSTDTGLSLTTRTVTYSAASPYDNPDWIAGTRNFFGIVDSGTGSSPVMTFTSTFTAPLQSNSYLVFTDVEFGEKVYVRAYNDASLIPYADLTFTKWNGGDPNGTAVNTTWNPEAGFSGLLLSGTPYGFSNPVVTLQSSQPISGLEYMIDMGSATNSLGFNFAAPIAVPEPSAMALVATALVGTTARMRRRRRRAPTSGAGPFAEDSLVAALQDRARCGSPSPDGRLGPFGLH